MSIDPTKVVGPSTQLPSPAPFQISQTRRDEPGMWVIPQASDDDLRRYVHANSELLQKKTRGMNREQANVYFELRYIRLNEKDPDVQERAGSLIRELERFVRDNRDTTSLLENARQITGGYFGTRPEVVREF